MIQEMHSAVIARKKIGGGGGSYTAKSVVLDIADNHGIATFLSVRSIDFYLLGSKIANLPADYTTYATSQFSGTYVPDNAFDTSLSKTGSWNDTQWMAGSNNITNQRLICVFDTDTEFDEIRINNGHSSGGFTGSGINNVVINISTDIINVTIYQNPITNATEIYDSTFDEHTASDVEDEQILNIGL